MASPDKNLDRARALLERAGHPNTPEEEARTAAVIAARMIYEHGFELSLPSSAPNSASTSSVEVKAARTAASTAAYADNIWKIWERNQKRSTKQAQEKYLVVKSRYAGDCQACHRSYKRGEAVAWRPKQGCVHYACRGFWEKSA